VDEPLIQLSHLQSMTMFAFFVSLVFAFLTKHGWKDRAKYFLVSFLTFLAVGIGLGWLMYPFPR
jgi:cytochrome bd-type quinol oxidase subunit 2